MIEAKLEDYVTEWTARGEGGPSNIVGLLYELAALAWKTRTDPASVSSLASAGVTSDDLQARFGDTT